MEHNQTFRISSPEILGNAVAMLSQVPTDGSVSVDIHKTKDKRRLSQNALYWMWMKDISAKTGNTTDAIHDGCRETYLAQIILAEPKGRLQKAWAKTYADITELVFDLPPEEATPVIKRVKRLCSTTWLEVDQFSEYLSLIERGCIARSIAIRHPEDYHYAMG